MPIYFLDTGEGEGSEETNITRRITLGDKYYSLNYRYNIRDESWIISLGLVGSKPLFTTKACCGRVLNEHYKHIPDVPQGDLLIVDITGKWGRTDLEGFSSAGRYRLVYSAENAS